MTSIPILIGVLLVAALQAVIVMGAAWIVLDRWFSGRERAIAAFSVSLAFWIGAYSHSSGDIRSIDPKALPVAAIQFGITMLLFKIELRRAKRAEGGENG